MKRLLFFFAVLLFTLPVFAQTSTIKPVSLSPAEIDRIVKKVTSNEAAFR